MSQNVVVLKSANKLLPLAALRFGAAFYIMMAHSYRFLPWHAQDPPEIVVRFFSLGYVLVSLFFILSGFVLAYVYLRDPTRPTIARPISKTRFFTARAARLLPVYLLALFIDTPHAARESLHLFHWSVFHFVLVWLANLFLLQAWMPNQLMHLNTPSWFLSVDVFFYLLFPWIGPLLWRLRTRPVVVFALFIYAAGLALTIPALLYPAWSLFLFFHPVAHLHEFLLGILLARLYVWIVATPGRARMLERSAIPVAIAAIAGIVILPGLTLSLTVNEYKILLQHGVFLPFYSLLILAFSAGNGVLHRLFANHWLLLLGESSYSLYLFHLPLVFAFHLVIFRYGFLGWAIYLTVCTAAGVVSLHYFEAPARRKILQWRDSRTRETLAVSSMA